MFAMRFPTKCYQIRQAPRQTMPHLGAIQSKQSALWLLGTITARGGCGNDVSPAGRGSGQRLHRARRGVRLPPDPWPSLPDSVKAIRPPNLETRPCKPFMGEDWDEGAPRPIVAHRVP